MCPSRMPSTFRIYNGRNEIITRQQPQTHWSLVNLVQWRFIIAIHHLIRNVFGIFESRIGMKFDFHPVFMVG